MSRRRLLVALAAAALLLAAGALAPAAASAHGLVGRADLPIPTWLFGWAAAIVLAVSFVALSSLWRTPRLQTPVERPLVPIPRVLDLLCAALGIAVFVAVVYAGYAGTKEATSNLAPVIVYVVFWVGFVVASLLFGDVFRALNPWRNTALLVRWLARGRGFGMRPYPARWGRWPAAIGIVLFAWLELIYTQKTDPTKLAFLALLYFVVMLAAMVVFGIEEWSDNADPFGVYFGMIATLSPLRRREDGMLMARRFLSGAPSWPLVPGSVALVCVAIGSTTFDGFENGPVWAAFDPDLQSFFKSLGASSNVKIELSGTVGLLLAIALVSLIYHAGVRGMQTVGEGHSAHELVGRFAHTLIPIAWAYALAHYFSLLIYQGQSVGYLVSDPLGNGSNIFGTAHATIDYGIISGSGIWYVQVAALVAGHVAGLVLAHDRAVAMYKNVRDATQSQYWMLVVMVGFTSLGLWLLSAVGQR